MIEETMRQIEMRVQRSGSLRNESRAELLELLATLKAEIAELSNTDPQRARAIADQVQASTHEVMRDDRESSGIAEAADSLSASVAGFEGKHPKLVEVVNRISTTLAGLGI